MRSVQNSNEVVRTAMKWSERFEDCAEFSLDHLFDQNQSDVNVQWKQGFLGFSRQKA